MVLLFSVKTKEKGVYFMMAKITQDWHANRNNKTAR